MKKNSPEKKTVGKYPISVREGRRGVTRRFESRYEEEKEEKKKKKEEEDCGARGRMAALSAAATTTTTGVKILCPLPRENRVR